MSHKLILNLAILVFSFAGMLHLVRIVAAWDLVLGGVLIPVWVSAIAVVVTAFLAYQIARMK